MAKNTETETRGRAGRPSSFPEGTEVRAFPSKTSAEAIRMIREMAAERQNPFGLSHNSIGAEAHRIIEQAYRRFEGERKRKNRKGRKSTPAPEAAPAPETENAAS